MRSLALALLLTAPAFAETRMTAAEFDAFATGRTLTYQRPNEVFGTEEYLPGRKIRWSDGSPGCYAGVWYPRNDGAICFLYQGTSEPACWSFVRDGERVRADYADDADSPVFDVVISQHPLPCSGTDKEN